MKNWYKTFELETHDIIIMKDFNNDKEQPFLLTTITNHNGLQIKSTLGFSKETDRDNGFEKADADFAEKMANLELLRLF